MISSIHLVRVSLRTLMRLSPAILLSCSSQTSVRSAPDFNLMTMDGRIISLSELKGKVVVLNFWATWCEPCKREIPGFIQVYNKYRDQGLEIIGASVDRAGLGGVISYMSFYKIPYPVALATKDMTYEYDKVEAIPTTFLINKEGNIVYRYVGYLPSGRLESKVKELLGFSSTE